MLLPTQMPLLSAPFPWFVAGGWALDLFVGKNTRTHSDLDLGILRQDQRALQNFLVGWDLEKAINGVFHPWKEGEELNLPVHEIHAKHRDLGEVEILIAESSDTDWLYRRDTRVKRKLSRAILPTNFGFSILAPEIVLLFKSKKPQPKDEADFKNVLPSLSSDQRNWLRESLKVSDMRQGWLALIGE